MKTKQERSEIFKLFQEKIKKQDSFEMGKQHFLELRGALVAGYDYIFTVCSPEDFYQMPLKKDKTIAYYLYH